MDDVAPVCALVVRGAPLASRAGDVAGALVQPGWEVCVVLTPAAVAVVPMTFNTVGKAAHGIADTAAHSTIAEALGRHVPVVAVPTVNEYLAQNAAWSRNVEQFTLAGVWWVRPADGTAGPPETVASGTGDEATAEFDPEWVAGHLPAVRDVQA